MSVSPRRVWAIVPAAGRGARFESAQHAAPKQYAALLGATVIEWSMAALLREPRVAGIVAVLAADDTRWPAIAASLGSTKLLTTIGGSSRQESVMNGLSALALHAAADDWVLVHDAARPCLTAVDLAALIDALQPAGRQVPAGSSAVDLSAEGAGVPAAGFEINGALLAAPVVDTVKRERGGIAVDTVDREGLWRALTPQVFGFAALKQALEDAARAGIAVTDEAQAMERLGLPARLVRGSPFNIKVTRAEDLSMAETILKSAAPQETKTILQGPLQAADQPAGRVHMRIGQGFDVHAFGEGDRVTLGGVTLPHPRGIVAHSDGDVVIHALCDAVLGALGEGDIGRHFPDSDPRYRGADSRVFLREVAALVRAAGFAVVNADITVMAEAPRIAKHRAAMAMNLAEDLGVPAQRINVKGTTTERLGFLGRGEGLAASAAVLLQSASPDGSPAGGYAAGGS